jgi:hypothetical protein
MTQIEAIAHLTAAVDRLAARLGPRPLVRRSKPPLRDARLTSGRLTREPAFYQPIEQALGQLGGDAAKAEVQRVLPTLMRFTREDCTRDPLGRIRWEQRASAAATTMRREKRLRPDAPRGRWMLPTRKRR